MCHNYVNTTLVAVAANLPVAALVQQLCVQMLVYVTCYQASITADNTLNLQLEFCTAGHDTSSAEAS